MPASIGMSILPPREDQAYALSGVSIPLLEDSRKRRSTGTFGKIVRGCVIEANGFRDLVLADLDKARSATWIPIADRDKRARRRRSGPKRSAWDVPP